MNKLFFISCLFLVGLIGFSSCSNEELTPPKEESVDVFEAREVVTNTLFLAALRNFWPVCRFGRGTCNWRNGGCDIAWAGDVNDGLDFIEQAEDADVLMDIETYEEQSSIGFRIKGFSSVFLDNASANGDNESIFTVSETLPLNPDVSQLLGFQNITLFEGEYEIMVDPQTGEQIVYVSANME